MPDHDVSDEDLAALITPLYAISVGITRVVSSKPAVNRLAVLQAVAHEGEARPSDIAAALQQHLPQVSRQVQTLVDEGLVTTSSSTGDRRSRVVRLTDAGRAEVNRLTAFGLSRWRHLTSDFEPAELRRLAELLTKLHQNMASGGAAAAPDGGDPE